MWFEWPRSVSYKKFIIELNERRLRQMSGYFEFEVAKNPLRGTEDM